jgi:hypothetical protein
LNVKKYIVQCRYHIEESIAYRVYAATKEDADYIARLKFRDDVHGRRILDAVSITEVVSEQVRDPVGVWRSVFTGPTFTSGKVWHPNERSLALLLGSS